MSCLLEVLADVLSIRGAGRSVLRTASTCLVVLGSIARLYSPERVHNAALSVWTSLLSIPAREWCPFNARIKRERERERERERNRLVSRQIGR